MDGVEYEFIAQTLRYAKSCAKYTDFITRTLMLTTQLMKQNFHAKLLDRKLYKWHTRSDKAVVMAKFGHDIKQIISDLTVITIHMEQNKKQETKTQKTKTKKKTTSRITNKTNLSTSEVKITWHADRASAG